MTTLFGLENPSLSRWLQMESFTADPAPPEVVHETSGFNLVSGLAGPPGLDSIKSLANPIQWLSIGGFQIVGDLFGWAGYRWAGIVGQIILDESASCLLSRSVGGAEILSGETLLDLGGSLFVRTLLTQTGRSLSAQPLARFFLVPLLFGAISAMQASIRGSDTQTDSLNSLGRNILGSWVMMIQGGLMMKGRSMISRHWSQSRSPNLVGWRLKETLSSTNRSVCYVSRDQGPKRIGAILAFLRSNPFDPENRHYEFEITGEIRAEDLRGLVRLPYEIDITERDSRLFLATGLVRKVVSVDDDHYSRSRSSRVSLHTHPFDHSDGQNGGPSIQDLVGHARDVQPTTPLLVIHRGGITLYRKPYWDAILGAYSKESGQEHIGRYERAFGIDDHPKDSFFPSHYFLLSEEMGFMRQYAKDSGAIIEEASWNDEVAISRMMDLINLKRPYEPPPLTPLAKRDFFHLPLDLPTRERVMAMPTQVRDSWLGQWLGQLSPDQMRDFLARHQVEPVRSAEFHATYAIKRWLLIGNDTAVAEGLPQILDDNLPSLSRSDSHRTALFNLLVPDLTVRSSRLESALTLLRKPTFQAYLRERYRFDLKDGHPRTLEEFIRLHPETKALDRVPPLSPEQQEVYLLIQKLDLLNPLHYGNPFEDFQLARQMARSEGSYERLYGDCWFLTTRSMNSQVHDSNPYALLKELYPDPDELWRRLGLEKPFQGGFPDRSLFWESDKTFWTIYQELKSVA